MTVTKTFSLTFFFIVIASAQTVPDTYKKDREACEKQFGLTDQELTAINNAGDLRPVGCYLWCLSVREGSMTKEGGLAAAVTDTPIPPGDTVDEAVLKCGEKVFGGKKPSKAKGCERAAAFTQCTKDSLPVNTFNNLGIFGPPTNSGSN